MIHPERIQILNDRPIRRGKYVLYWMQQAQRAECNHALEYAIQLGNERSEPAIVLFGLTDSYPEAYERHYAFLLEGLRDVQRALRGRNVQFVLRQQSPELAALELGQDASLVVVDRGYLRLQRDWRKHVAGKLPCQFVQVESDVVVPIETGSTKEEYAARTIRPKIHRHLKRFLMPVKESQAKRSSLRLRLGGLDAEDVDNILSGLRIDRTVRRVDTFQGGTNVAKRLLDNFLRSGVRHYAEQRGDPSLGCVSHLSPYLHFGQISPLYVALRIMQVRGKGLKKDRDAFLEELIVRRELSMNFIYYNGTYDTFDCLPGWARETLHKHGTDPREDTYDLAEWEQARTHDPYWNAAQREMMLTGYMHNTMRMYWGKKILEWSANPEEAFRIALYLNNKYELDGRDANSFAGIAWCFGKHDRPWGKRPVYGTVRCMIASGLERKYDMEAYVKRVASLQVSASR